MKKGKLILSFLTVFAGVCGAFAFKTIVTGPGNLWYLDENGICVKAPCETVQHTPSSCPFSTYDNNDCTATHTGSAWETIDGSASN